MGNWHLLLQTNEATCILPLTGGVRVFVCENLALYGAYAPETMFPSLTMSCPNTASLKPRKLLRDAFLSHKSNEPRKERGE
jgi:hypothetical protein